MTLTYSCLIEIKIITNTNNEIGTILKWFHINRLSLNAYKTNYMIFKSHQKRIKSDKYDISMGHTRYKLLLCEHIKYIKNTFSKDLGILYKCRKLSKEIF